MDRNTYPTGWDKKRVQEVIDHLETRTEEETIAEDEAAFERITRQYGFPANSCLSCANSSP